MYVSASSLGAVKVSRTMLRDLINRMLHFVSIYKLLMIESNDQLTITTYQSHYTLCNSNHFTSIAPNGGTHN